MTVENAERAGRAEQIRVLLGLILEPMRAKARELGYAIATHGSLARDIDLVAIPWVDGAVCAHELLASMIEVIREATGGVGWMSRDGDALDRLRGTTKPHGRRAWSIFVGHDEHDVYVDLSVMPRK